MNTTRITFFNDKLPLSNWSNVTQETMEFHSGAEAIIAPVIFSVVFLIGIIGNAILFIYMMRRRKMTSPHNIYVISLAVGDFLLVIVSMPFMSTIYTFNNWPYGETVCKLSEFVLTLCTSATVYMLSALSIQRYIIISSRHSEHQNSMAVIVVFIVWVFSFMFAVPDLVTANLDGPSGSDACFVYRHSWGEAYAKTMTVLKLLFQFIIPVTVTAPIYIMTVCRLLKTTRQTCQGNMYTRENGKKFQIIVLILTLIIVFIFSWLPRHTFLIWFYFYPSPYNEFWHIFKIIGFCLMYANSAFNPVVFFVLDPDIRNFALSCCKSYRKRKYKPSNSRVTIDEHTIILTELIHINDSGTMV